MSEKIPNNTEEGRNINDNEKELTRELRFDILMRLSSETFPFSGINAKSYSELKAIEEEFPGLTTPIDELIERFKVHGMKVVVGKNLESGNFFILPCDSDNIEEDSVLLESLHITDDMREDLKIIIKAEIDKANGKYR